MPLFNRQFSVASTNIKETLAKLSSTDRVNKVSQESSRCEILASSRESNRVNRRLEIAFHS